MKFKKLFTLCLVLFPTIASAQNMSVPNIDSSFKTFMPYTAITSTSSKQYELQKEAMTFHNGIRVHESGRYMVAVGTHYAKEVGTKLDITLDNGYTFHAIVGDIKQNKHTDATNRYVPINESVLEFIVDMSEIPDVVMKTGDVSYTNDNLKGEVVSIKKVS